jgi:hypothetical protein
VSKVYCDDWSCPARVSCAHHFGRSAAYAGMREGSKVESVVHSGIYKRDADKDSCSEYRLDKPKDWLDFALSAIPSSLSGDERNG